MQKILLILFSILSSLGFIAFIHQFIPYYQSEYKNQDEWIQFIEILSLFIFVIYIVMAIVSIISYKSLAKFAEKNDDVLLIKPFISTESKQTIDKLLSIQKNYDQLILFNNKNPELLDDYSDLIKYILIQLIKNILTNSDKEILRSQINKKKLTVFDNQFENDNTYQDIDEYINNLKILFNQNSKFLSEDIQWNNIIFDENMLTERINPFQKQFIIIIEKIIVTSSNKLDFKSNFHQIIHKNMQQTKQDTLINSIKESKNSPDLINTIITMKNQDIYNSLKVIKDHTQNSEYIWNNIECHIVNQGVNSKNPSPRRELKFIKSFPSHRSDNIDANVSQISNNSFNKDSKYQQNQNVDYDKIENEVTLEFANERSMVDFKNQFIKVFGKNYDKEIEMEEYDLNYRVKQVEYNNINSIQCTKPQNIKYVFEIYNSSLDLSFLFQCYCTIESFSSFRKAINYQEDIKCIKQDIENEQNEINKNIKLDEYQDQIQKLLIYVKLTVQIIISIFIMTMIYFDQNAIECQNGNQQQCTAFCFEIENIKNDQICENQFLNFKLQMKNNEIDQFCNKQIHNSQIAESCYEHYQFKDKFQFLDGIQKNNICYLQQPNLIKCLSDNVFTTEINQHNNKFKKLSISEESQIGINQEDKLISKNLKKQLINQLEQENIKTTEFFDSKISNDRYCVLSSSSNLICSGFTIKQSMIQAGGGHNCIITPESLKLECWGRADEEQSAVPQGFTNDAFAVATGLQHSCGIRQDRRLLCWGSNAEGQTDVPQDFVFPNDLISAGGSHSCGRHSEGKGMIFCFGSNDKGQTKVPEELSSGVETTAGMLHSCARTAEGRVGCWGSNEKGQSDLPASISFVKIAAGGFFTCALQDPDSMLTCFGSNVNGQTIIPDAVKKGIRAISGGQNHACAIRDDHLLRCWGSNNSKQSHVPDSIADGARAVSAGRSHTCGVQERGGLMCWGSNYYGQTEVDERQNFTIQFNQDEVSEFILNGKNLCYKKGNWECIINGVQTKIAVEYSNDHSACMTKKNMCFVSDSEGSAQCIDFIFGKVQFRFKETVSQLSCGYDHACVLQMDESVECMGGDNEQNELNLGPNLMSKVAAIKAGYQVTCAFKKDFKIQCQGKNFGDTFNEVKIDVKLYSKDHPEILEIEQYE